MKTLILLATVFFPLIAPIWEKGPLDAKNTLVPQALPRLDDRQLDELAAYFKQATDPRMRSSLAMDLANCNNPYGEKIACELLSGEKNDFVCEDLLSALNRMRDTQGLPSANPLKVFFNHQSPRVRAYAAAVYLRKTGDGTALANMLAGEDSEFTTSFLLNELAKRPDSCPQDKLISLLDPKIIPKRAGAAYALALNSPDPDALAPLQKLLADQSTAVRAALARGLAERKKDGGNKLLDSLSADTHPSVRALAASAPANEVREKFLLKLSADPDYEVRRAACTSLRHRNSDAAVNALIGRLGDESLLVRSAAEDSLAEIKPGKGAVEKISAGIADPKSRDSAIRCLGLLKAEEHAPLIVSALEKAESAETIIRCADALALIGYKPAASALSAKDAFPEASVRRAIAISLGKLGVKESYPSLEKLASDKDNEVVQGALQAMGIVGDPYFAPLLGKQALNFSMTTPPETRAAACWSLGRTGSNDASIINGMKDICSKEVLSVMGQRMCDSDFVRASALFTLVELSRKNTAGAEEAFNAMSEWLRNPPKDKFASVSDSLLDFLRQAELYKKGQKAEPAELPVSQLEPVMTKLKKK
ncbi:MAG: hypothetical protein A2X49_04995 [Lentisphaerae bacterium GWF2_52_8]|nr:MAG: hypothetical protein A2X49_04995 [Lentisphaerae bacterium GWF2_52_8]